MFSYFRISVLKEQFSTHVHFLLKKKIQNKNISKVTSSKLRLKKKAE